MLLASENHSQGISTPSLRSLIVDGDRSLPPQKVTIKTVCFLFSSDIVCIIISGFTAFSALTLLVGQQEGRLACKN